MILQKLIDEGKLEKFSISVNEIKKRFEKGKTRLSFAKQNFNQKTPDSFYDAIFTGIYDAARLVAEAFILLNGYRARLKDHHKTVMTTTIELMKNEKDMEFILRRLNKMRMKRNIVDYNLEDYDISAKSITQALEDVEKFSEKISKYIEKKDPQQRIK